MLQAFAYVAEPYAPVPVVEARRPRTVVAHTEHELIVDPDRRYLDSADAGNLFHPVLHRIFDQWLKDEARHERFARLVGYMHIDLELVVESYLHDLEVSLEEGYLLGHDHFRLVTAIQSVAQQLAQPCYHASHSTRVPLDERRHSMKRVEEKMRIELRIERRELRLRELRLKLRGLAL